MGLLKTLGRYAWRKWKIDGVSASGFNKLDLGPGSDIYAFVDKVDAAVGAVTGGFIGVDTKANLDADLAHAAGTLALVYGDSTAANNTTYVKSGASGAGSWSAIPQVAEKYLILDNDDSGDGDAITLSSTLALPSGAYGGKFLSHIIDANTGAVTIAINGGTAKALVTNSGAAMTAGYLAAGMVIEFVDDGTNYRLTSDVASAAIQTAAEAAQTAAEAARDAAIAAIPTAFVTTRTALAQLDPGDGTHAYVTELNMANHFEWDASDRSADVDGIDVVAPGVANPGGLATDGTEGAWIRQFPVNESANVRYQIDATGAARTVFARAKEEPTSGDFGMVGDGTTDNVAAYNAAIAYCAANARILKILPGVFGFDSNPNAITEKLRIEGVGYSSALFRRNFASGGGNTDGLIRSTYPALEILNLGIEANAAHSGGACAISVISTAGVAAASKLLLENVWVTTQVDDGWSYPIYVDGKARDSGTVGTAIGARDIFFKNVHCFGCSAHAVTLYSVVGMSWKGGGLYTAGGTSTSSIQVTGNADPKSWYVDIDISVINGDVTLSQAEFVTIATTTIGGNVYNASNVNYSRIRANLISGATQQTLWTNSAYDVI